MRLRAIEEEVICNLEVQKSLIATGGSAAYSDKAMAHLKLNGVIVFLDLALSELYSRITNFDTRGIACRADQTFEDLFNERLPLYRKWADITIDCQGKSHEETVRVIEGEISRM
jgi:shikimate kinase